MKYFLLLLSHVAALQVSPDTVKDIEKPLCKNASEVGGGGKWKSVKETQVSRLPNLKERGYQKGCSYDKFMTYEPPTCKLPTHLYEVQKRPKRVMFVGDSVTDYHAQSFSWYYQGENRNVQKKPCTFVKEDWQKHLKAAGRFDQKTIDDTVLWMEKQGGNNGKNGHLWWGCQNSSVMYAPALTLEGKNPEVWKAFMYTVKTWVKKPLGPEDVIVMNVGLHGLKDGFYKNLDHMDRKWTPAITSMMEEYKEWKKEGDAPKLIWRQVSPQHWQGDSGYWSPNAPKDCSAIRSLKKQEERKEKYPSRNNDMFLTAVEKAGLHVDGHDIEIMPIWRASADRWDEHPLLDCTHFCSFGGVTRYWNSALLVTAAGMLTEAPKEPKSATALKVALKGRNSKTKAAEDSKKEALKLALAAAKASKVPKAPKGAVQV